MRPFIEALRSSRQLDLVWDLGATRFAKMIEKRLKVLSPRAVARGASSAIVSKFCAGALMEMLKWWIDRDDRPTPEQMDVIYHDLVWRAVGISTAN